MTNTAAVNSSRTISQQLDYEILAHFNRLRNMPTEEFLQKFDTAMKEKKHLLDDDTIELVNFLKALILDQNPAT